MNKTNESLNADYVQKKRQQLVALRDQLLALSSAAESEESAARIDTSQQAREYEDDAQKLDRLETDGELVSLNIARLERIERALKKIDDGTYGFSDVSGHRIPDARLDAMPEAVTTLAEQEAAEVPPAADRRSL